MTWRDDAREQLRARVEASALRERDAEEAALRVELIDVFTAVLVRDEDLAAHRDCRAIATTLVDEFDEWVRRRGQAATP